MIFLIAIRNAFPARKWKNLRRNIIEQHGNRCQRCGNESVTLALHHVHYRSFGNEQPEDVELLCGGCHTEADEARALNGRPKRDYPEGGMIVGEDGDRWEKFDPNTIYIPLTDGRYAPVIIKPKESPNIEKLKNDRTETYRPRRRQ
jgi:hypothetical protein